MQAGDVVVCDHGDYYWLVEYQYESMHNTFTAKILDVNGQMYRELIGNTYSFRHMDIIKDITIFDYDLGEKN